MLPVWKQKTKKHVGKRFGSKVDLDKSIKMKTEDPLMCCSPAQKVRLVSTSECSNTEEQDNAEGSGQAPSATESVSIAAVRSLVKPREKESVDSRAFRDLEELLDVPSGSKENSNISSGSKISMRRSSRNGSKRKPRIGDKRKYSYDEIIECQEKLNDSDEFQFCIDDVEKNF